MNFKNKYFTEFLILIFTSLILVFLLDKPLRDYIPVIFAIIGFGRFTFITWRNYYILSNELVTNHKKSLIKYKIDFGETGNVKQVDVIRYNKCSFDLKISLSYCFSDDTYYYHNKKSETCVICKKRK